MKAFGLYLVSLVALTTVVLANPTDLKSLSQRNYIPRFESFDSRAACPESYSPCTCDSTSNGLEVTCLDTKIEEIKSVFYKTKTQGLYSITLRASATGTVALPSDLLSDKTVKRISLQCPIGVATPLDLTINSATFQYTRRNTTFFEIKDCDFQNQPDFAFLNGFEVLDTLRLERTLNIAGFATLPSSTMRAIKVLTIVNNTGLAGIPFPDFTPATLTRLNLDGNGLSDTNINGILVSVASSSSVNSLQELTITRNVLTKVPRIGSFSKLNRFDVSNNNIPYITEFGLNFNAGTKVSFVGLTNITLTFIEDGAFAGDFSKAVVNLEANKLAEFREGAFKDILRQMTVQPPATGGLLIVTNNPFECGCSLAWLIRDNPNLIPTVINGVCGGFFKFEDLNPNSYKDCP